jgi:hypothetical protein
VQRLIRFTEAASNFGGVGSVWAATVSRRARRLAKKIFITLSPKIMAADTFR